MILFPAILRGNHCKNLISSIEFSGMLIMLCCPRYVLQPVFFKDFIGYCYCLVDDY